MRIKITSCLILMYVLLSNTAIAQDAVSKSLLVDIQNAQQRLNKLEENIANETRSLAEEIQKQQNQVLSLRQKVAVKRRVLDDQTLALSKIESRVNEWQRQENYQQNMLIDIAQRNGLSGEQLASMTTGLGDSQSYLTTLAIQQRNSLNLDWTEQRILLSNGQYQNAKVLQAGPVKWFLLPQSKQTGLLDSENKVQLNFNADISQQLLSLFETKRGLITFDPTLGNVVKKQQQQESPAQHLLRGGVWVIPIIGFGFFALMIGIAKSVQLYRLPKLQPMLAERIELLQASANASDQLSNLSKNLKGAQKQLVEITLDCSVGEKRDNRLLAFLLEYRQRLQSNLGAVAITASVAPLIGLLGTVSGMIETFKMMSLFGTGDPTIVSGGISKALITTELGLVVAIPALVIHALLNRFIRNHNTQLDATAIKLGKVSTQNPPANELQEQAA
ncbi:MotA/TolQ/ExbB proton channel family protein [Aliiglaciecola lipolytica]|uniref:Biopolymer transport protein ExbB n=1 Tax=Aliiglaciecola lipolytica E3 TaxID=1127673 RepID=K6Y393_9ALTE|nr:MotA/TolQ/ExbB proton channel family protein [Aliiglaciecola lipolytica]GAC12737.1 biopolymer transport protein ExbB [Aliiglaciecola lipolytica E3]